MRGLNLQEIVVVSRGNGWLRLRFADGVKTKDASRLFAEIRQQALAEKARELLIDASAIQEKLSVLRRLQLIMAFVTHLRGFRVAGVLSEITIDPKRLGETMAQNRGANVKVFTRMPDALAWLGWEQAG
jgi:hypothetical protein